MARTAQDYAGALRRLMPTGRAWRFEAGSRQAQLARALARAFARIDNQAEAMLAAYLPGDNINLVPEWEETLGLTDGTASLSIEQRQARIRARFTAGNGPSLPFVVSLADRLGMTISITRYAPARAGIMAAGDPVCDENWCSAVGITVTANTGVNAPADLIAALQPYSAHIFFFLLP